MCEHLEQLIQTNQWTDAQSYCATWLTQVPTSEEALHKMGFICAKLGELKEAILYFKKAISHNPNRVSSHINISNVYTTLGNLEEARQHLYQALRLNGHHAEAYNNLGHLCYRQNLLEESILYFKKALRINPNYWEAHYNLAHSFAKQNRLSYAAVHYTEVIRLVPDHANAHFNLGLIYFEEESYAKAEEALKKAIELNPDSITALYYFAQTALALSNTEAAKCAFETILTEQLNNDSTIDRGEIHHNLAILYLRNDQKEKALHHFEQALALQPMNETACHMIAALTATQTSTKAPNAYIVHLFDQYAEYYDNHVKQTLSYAVPGLLRSAVGRCLGSRIRTGRVLDLGCGTGLCGVYFRELAFDMIGVDISPKMVEKAKALGAYDSVVTAEIVDYLNDYKRMPGFQPFDLIIAGDVLVYLGDLHALFQSVAAVLASNGHFAFTIEEALPSQHMAPYYLNPTGRYAHRRDSIALLAEKNHLTIAFEECITLREHAGNPINGRLFLLRPDPGVVEDVCV